MYTLYWSPGSAAMAPHAALEEIGTPYKLVPVDISPGKPRDPAYLKLNPQGKVPTLVLEDGRAMYESAAIMLHLAERHPEAGLAPPVGDPLRPFYHQWLVHLTNTLQPAYTIWYYPERYTTNPAATDDLRARAAEELLVLWERVNQALAGGPYLLGERFSGCDLFLQMLAGWQDPLPQLYQRCRNVKRCVDLVLQRPAVQRMLRQNDAAA